MDNIGLMSETVNFIQGSKRNYDSSTMQGGVYFSKDSKEIFLNGESYGNAVPADEEDLTSVNRALQLKDREVDADNFQSKGYVILRKNLVQQEDGNYKNILTQDMINKPNTIYEIRYDFDLNGGTINIPENCTLKFEGGSFGNGTINLNNSRIEGTCCLRKNLKIFDDNESIFQLIWVEDYINNFDYGLELSLSFAGINIPKYDYFSYKTFNVTKENFVIYGNDSKINVITKDNSFVFINHVAEYSLNTNKFKIYNLHVKGTYDTTNRYGYGTFFQNTNQISLELNNVTIEHFNIGLKLQTIISSHIYNANIKFNNIGITVVKGKEISTTFFIKNSYIHVNAYNVILNEGVILDIHFIQSIFEGSVFSNVLDYGLNQLIVFENCYFETNSTGRNLDGAFEESDEVSFTIYENKQENKENLLFQKNVSIVFSNCVVYGSNYENKRGSCVKFNAGSLYITNCRFSRFLSIIELSDKYKNENTIKYRINVCSNNFYSSDINLINDFNYLDKFLDEINIQFYGNTNTENYTSCKNLFGYAKNSITEGFVNIYGFNGAAINSKAIRIEGIDVFYFNKYGCMILGNKKRGGSIDFNSSGIVIPDTISDINTILLQAVKSKMSNLSFVSNYKGRLFSLVNIIPKNPESEWKYDYGYLFPTITKNEEDRLTLPDNCGGTLFFNNTNKKMEYWDGKVWRSFQYFDTTLNKPIWWTGTKWVDSMGIDADSDSWTTIE